MLFLFLPVVVAEDLYCPLPPVFARMSILVRDDFCPTGSPFYPQCFAMNAVSLVNNLYASVGRCLAVEPLFRCQVVSESFKPSGIVKISDEISSPRVEAVPCPTCETSRKDRKFIKGSAYDFSLVRVLADRAGSSTGARLVAHAEGISGASEILNSDDSRYLLCRCGLRKKWFTLRLDEEIYLERIGLVSMEFFSGKFRHVQILGSQKYPTNEWRLLGEVETTVDITHEWFDLSGSSKCKKCFVRYLKIRVLSTHDGDGFSKCTLTKLQAFGSTMLQSIDRLAGGADSNEHISVQGEKISKVIERIDRELGFDIGLGTSPVLNGTTKESTDEGENPLLRFINDMSELRSNYAKVTSSLSSLSALVQRQEIELHAYRQNTTLGIVGNLQGDSDFAFWMVCAVALVIGVVLIVNQVYLFKKIENKEHIKILPPSPLSSSPSHSSRGLKRKPTHKRPPRVILLSHHLKEYLPKYPKEETQLISTFTEEALDTAPDNQTAEFDDNKPSQYS